VTLKLLSKRSETLCALLLERFMVKVFFHTSGFLLCASFCMWLGSIGSLCGGMGHPSVDGRVLAGPTSRRAACL